MAYRSNRSEISERDYAHRRAPVRDYEDDISDRADRTPAFLREDVRRTEAGPLVLRSREVETVDRRRPRSPSPPQVRYLERIVDRERERVPSPLPERRPVRFAERSPSPPPRVHIVERERVERRQRERSPTPEREREMFHLHIEREKRRERTPSPSPSPPPPPQPQPPPVIRGPTIEREVITHYRDIDHGVVRAKPPTPPPAPAPRRAPSRARSRAPERETDIDIDISRHETEIDIRQRTRSRSRPRERPRPQARPSYDDDDLIVVRNRDKLKVTDTQRRRAHSAAPRPEWDEESEYITSKIDSRGRMGEAKHGVTKDWTIIDVPPGTERVKMDGVGGGGAEVTWQRYNGVRRSKFIPDRDDSPTNASVAEPAPDTSRDRLSVQIYDSKHHDHEIEIDEVRDRRISIRDSDRHSSKKREGMWTEITKDLVNREAIERLGYEYEETEFFFYVMQYLRYEDVLEMVDFTDEIRRRRRRAREYEEHDSYLLNRRHQHSHSHSHRHSHWDKADDERIVEREVIYDSAPRYYR